MDTISDVFDKGTQMKFVADLGDGLMAIVAPMLCIFEALFIKLISI